MTRTRRGQPSGAIAAIAATAEAFGGEAAAWDTRGRLVWRSAGASAALGVDRGAGVAVLPPGAFSPAGDLRASGDGRTWRVSARRLASGLTFAVSSAPEAPAAEQTARLEALGTLTGGIAHDFNNILGAITGAVEVAASRVSDPTATRMLDIALLASRQGAQLARRLTAFARRQPAAEKQVDVAAALNETIQIARRTVGGARLTLEVAQDVGAVSCDAGQLENAILNLVLNARDAILQAGRSGAITVSAEIAGDGFIEIAVSDDGCGMSDVVKARAMEPFFSTKGPDHGAGLGLSAVYGFARNAGGAVGIESVEGVGSCVRLRLPRAGSACAAEPGERPAGTGAPPPGLRALVVEDEPRLREVTAAVAAELGLMATPVPTGAAALALLDAGTTFDVLLTDVVMPGLDGFALAVEARKRLPGLAVVYVSGYTALRDDPRMVEPGPFLAKPCGRAELSEALTRALAARPAS